jgi:hypothetical protein
MSCVVAPNVAWLRKRAASASLSDRCSSKPSPKINMDCAWPMDGGTNSTTAQPRMMRMAESIRVTSWLQG